MKLLADAQRAQLLANGAAQRQAVRGGADEREPLDAKPVVKLSAPDGRATSLLTKLDADNAELAFGLCDPGWANPRPTPW